jgi:hypothetical protein
MFGKNNLKIFFDRRRGLFAFTRDHESLQDYSVSATILPKMIVACMLR